MASVATWVFENKPMADGSFRVFLRLTNNYSRAYRATAIKVYPGQFERAKNGYLIKDKRINLMLRQLINEMELTILDMGIKTQHYSASLLMKVIFASDQKKQPDFVDFAEYYIRKNFVGREGSAVTYRTAVKRLREYMGKNVIRADEITVRLLNNFEKHLRDRGLERGVSLYLGAIHKLFLEFRLEYNNYDEDVIIIKNNPFEAYKVPKPTTKKKKRTLTLEELKGIRDYQCKNDKDTFARDMFMLSFYLVGMNTRDLFDCPAPVFGRIEYNRCKTKDRREDQAFISIKVEPEAQAIIDKYKGKKVLLDVKSFTSFKEFNNILNKRLKNIAPGLFFYMARHTWASLARNKCDVSKDDVAMALNHVDQALRTTDTYIDTDWTIIDRANRKVLDYLSSCQQ